MSNSEIDADGAVLLELTRIFGASFENAGKAFVALPLAGRREALDFLRSVPTNTSLEQFPELAAAYRATHPVRILDPEDADLESAG